MNEMRWKIELVLESLLFIKNLRVSDEEAK
jgi:hypothetical protein